MTHDGTVGGDEPMVRTQHTPRHTTSKQLKDYAHITTLSIGALAETVVGAIMVWDQEKHEPNFRRIIGDLLHWIFLDPERERLTRIATSVRGHRLDTLYDLACTQTHTTHCTDCGRPLASDYTLDQCYGCLYGTTDDGQEEDHRDGCDCGECTAIERHWETWQSSAYEDDPNYNCTRDDDGPYIHRDEYQPWETADWFTEGPGSSLDPRHTQGYDREPF